MYSFCLTTRNLRKELLKELHSTHACAERMWKTIRSIWMWPALRNEIRSYVSQCPSCAETARRKTHQPPPEIPEEMLIIGPMDQVGVDLFHLEGHDYLIMVDHFSNYKWVKEMKRTHSQDIIKAMEDWFHAAGVPRCVRSDGGPQFRGEYANWLASLGILQETSSPYNSPSNGLSEKGVQDVKNMMKRQGTRYDLSKLTADTNGMARSGMDESPADLFFNRTVRSAIPGSGRRMLDLAKVKEKRKEEQKSIRRPLGRGRLSLDTFQEGDRIRIQDPRTNIWRTTG